MCVWDPPNSDLHRNLVWVPSIKVPRKSSCRFGASGNCREPRSFGGPVWKIKTTSTLRPKFHFFSDAGPPLVSIKRVTPGRDLWATFGHLVLPFSDIKKKKKN